MTIVELQTHHGYGVMSFPKLAHMSGGDYIFHDLRTVDSRRLLDVGIAVPEHVVEQVVNTAVKVHNFRNSLRIEHRTVTVGWSERLWSAINVFGTSKPVSWTETIVSESSKVTDEELHITSAEIRVAVVEPGSGTFHVKMQQNGVSAEQPQRYLTILNNILGVQYSVHSMDTWITDAYTNASLSNTHSRGSKSSSKRHQLKDSDKQLATIRRNNGTYWILFNPSVSAYSKVCCFCSLFIFLF